MSYPLCCAHFALCLKHRDVKIKEMTNMQSIKCELCGKEMLPEESEVIEEGRGLLVCDKCAYEHKKG